MDDESITAQVIDGELVFSPTISYLYSLAWTHALQNKHVIDSILWALMSTLTTPSSSGKGSLVSGGVATSHGSLYTEPAMTGARRIVNNSKIGDQPKQLSSKESR